MSSSNAIPTINESGRIRQAILIVIQNRYDPSFGRLEQDVARYVFLIFMSFFPSDIWNPLPQFRTTVGMIPDLVYEQLILKKGVYTFAPGIFAELKSVLSTEDSITQLLRSICMEHGPTMRSKGFLIGVEGFKWTILDYHFIKTQNGTECLAAHFFYHNTSEGIPKQDRRPVALSGPYEDKIPMDIEIPGDFKDLQKALFWIGRGNRARNLLDMAKIKDDKKKDPSKHLSFRLSDSTFKFVQVNDEEIVQEMNQDQVLGTEFTYLSPMF